MAFSTSLLSLMSLYVFSITLLSTSFLSVSINIDTIIDLDLPFNSIKSAADVHDLLPKYGLPRGLIPDAVKSYSISEDGSFEMEFEHPCYVMFDRLVYFDRRVKGKVSYGCISDVSGIQAKKLFLWVSVTRIQVDSDPNFIEFYVGALSEKLPAKQFENVPTCKSKGCQRSKLESS